MRKPGIEPGPPPWEGGILATELLAPTRNICWLDRVKARFIIIYKSLFLLNEVQ